MECSASGIDRPGHSGVLQVTDHKEATIEGFAALVFGVQEFVGHTGPFLETLGRAFAMAFVGGMGAALAAWFWKRIRRLFRIDE
jgi:hypothetical protein